MCARTVGFVCGQWKRSVIVYDEICRLPPTTAISARLRRRRRCARMAHLWFVFRRSRCVVGTVIVVVSPSLRFQRHSKCRGKKVVDVCWTKPSLYKVIKRFSRDDDKRLVKSSTLTCKGRTGPRRQALIYTLGSCIRICEDRGKKSYRGLLTILTFLNY